MKQTFFISDLHFGHRNVLAYDNRPFATIEEHDEELIKRWNSRLSSNDTGWILGDLGWYSSDRMESILKRLNGEKRLCIGNHDKKLLENPNVRSQFVEICDYKEIYLSRKQGIVLSHYPSPCFNRHFYGWLHFYGHVHNSFEWNMMERVKYEMEALYDKPCHMFNVGCMMPYMDYTPRTAEEIVQMASPSYGELH